MILQDVAPAVPGMLNTRQGLDKLVTLYSTLNARTQSKAAFIRGVVQQGQMNYDQATQAFNQMYPAQMWTSHVDPLKYNGNPAQLKPGYGYTVGGATGIWNGQTFVPVGGN
ncbi:MAG: hypothetical protein B7Z68_00400 [Acidobacteria bacterium 21-70-11]|nr:MAG: hypothetical protein B7Z68_00400 [Acidobacteria bacterium 21-70-11]